MSTSDISFLAELESVIGQRIASGGAASYTAELARAGGDRIAQKLGEDAVELVVAAVSGDTDGQREEAADLVYHLLVLLQYNGLAIADVVDALKERHKAEG